MEPSWLLDTNICTYALSGRYPALAERIDARPDAAAVLSVVVWGELLYGIAKSTRKKDSERRLAALVDRVAIAPLPADAGGHYGDLRARLEHRGTPIGANDLWIAAHARAAGLAIVPTTSANSAACRACGSKTGFERHDQ